MKGWVLPAVALAGALGGAVAMWAIDARSGGAVGPQVRAYLLAHPEVIPEAMAKLQDRESGKLIAARRADDGGWEFVVVRHGRLASAGRSRRGVAPMPVVEALVAGAETVVPDATPLRGATPEEVALIARWLESGGVRIVDTTDGWCEPAHGAGRWAAVADRDTG